MAAVGGQSTTEAHRSVELSPGVACGAGTSTHVLKAQLRLRKASQSISLSCVKQPRLSLTLRAGRKRAKKHSRKNKTPLWKHHQGRHVKLLLSTAVTYIVRTTQACYQ